MGRLKFYGRAEASSEVSTQTIQLCYTLGESAVTFQAFYETLAYASCGKMLQIKQISALPRTVLNQL